MKYLMSRTGVEVSMVVTVEAHTCIVLGSTLLFCENVVYREYVFGSSCKSTVVMCVYMLYALLS